MSEQEKMAAFTFSTAPEGVSIQTRDGETYLVIRSGPYTEWCRLSGMSAQLAERAIDSLQDTIKTTTGYLSTCLRCIENGLSAVENPIAAKDGEVDRYLLDNWQPFARSLADELKAKPLA